MGWLDKVKQTAEKAAGEAGEMAAIGKLKIEIRTLTGKMEDAFKAMRQGPFLPPAHRMRGLTRSSLPAGNPIHSRSAGAIGSRQG